MILVTGAAGKTGKAVIKALAAKGASVRALVRRPEHAGALLALGAAEVTRRQLRRPQRADARRRRNARDLSYLPQCQPETKSATHAPSPTPRKQQG